MKAGMPVWRSLLYVPANVEKYVDKAHTRGADCVQIDLEDSVPAAEKDQARALVPAVAARVRRGGADVVVRINRPLSLAVRDLEAAVGPDVNGIAVTKVQSADHLKLLDELVGDHLVTVCAIDDEPEQPTPTSHDENVLVERGCAAGVTEAPAE